MEEEEHSDLRSETCNGFAFSTFGGGVGVGGSTNERGSYEASMRTGRMLMVKAKVSAEAHLLLAHMVF